MIAMNGVAWLFCVAGITAAGLCQAAETRTVVVRGHATIEAVPDIASVAITVSSQAPAATTALDATSAGGRQVINFAKQFGVGAGDLSTTSVTLGPSFKYRNENGRSISEPDGYTASNSVTIRLRDLSRIGTLLREW